LEAGYRWAYDRFYSWGSIWRRQPTAAAQRVAFWEFNLFSRKFGKLTCWLGRLCGMRNLARLARAAAYPHTVSKVWKTAGGNFPMSGKIAVPVSNPWKTNHEPAL
jgi:hypothetical protein